MRRSWVTPKLVSNGCRSRMCSSRISICLMNTGRSRDKQIFAPFVFPLKSRDEIVFLKVFQQLLANAQLHILRGLQALLLDGLNIRRNENAAHVTLDLWPGPVNPPLGNHAIGFKALLQARCRGTIQIHIIPSYDRAQFLDVEVSILGLERLEGPLNHVNTTLQCMDPLRLLEVEANAGVPVIRCDRQHLRVPVGHAVANSRHRIEKSDEAIRIKCTEDQSSDVRLNTNIRVGTRSMSANCQASRCNLTHWSNSEISVSGRIVMWEGFWTWLFARAF